MPEIVKEALVPHSREAMFDLVLDIQSYPLFLPWCPKVEIHTQEVSTEEPNTTFTDATLFVQKGFMSFSFRTKNLNKKADFIQMNLIEGPFKELHGTWEFLPLSPEPVDQKKTGRLQNQVFSFICVCQSCVRHDVKPHDAKTGGFFLGRFLPTSKRV